MRPGRPQVGLPELDQADHERYHNWFATYARDGILMGEDALILFSQTGLSRETLGYIWCVYSEY